MTDRSIIYLAFDCFASKFIVSFAIDIHTAQHVEYKLYCTCIHTLTLSETSRQRGGRVVDDAFLCSHTHMGEGGIEIEMLVLRGDVEID